MIWIVVGVWLVVVAAALGLVYQYKLTPGAEATAPARWPAGSTIPHTDGRATLVLLAHPQCPCTRASLTELANIVEQLGGRADTIVIFVMPDNTGDDWMDTDTIHQAREIPGVRVVFDRGGAEAKRFGAQVSGHVLVYDPHGVLVFSGGITASRGHEGDSFGRHRVLAAISGRVPDRPTAPTFGCALFDSD